MFTGLARFSIRFRWYVLAAFLVLGVVAGVVGGGVAKSLKTGGFDDPNAEATRARRQIAADFGAGDADIIALYSVQHGRADDPAARATVGATLNRIAQDPSVRGVAGFYNTGAAQFLSRDGASTFAAISLQGNDQAKSDAVKRLRPLLQADGATLQLGGLTPVNDAVQKSVEQDLQRAELIAFPITAVLLVVVFGSLVSASVPLALGGLAIMLAFLVLRVLALFTDVSVFALNIVTTLGLGLAIDYSLFILNRYREELPALGREAALVKAIGTTGRAVAFSGLTLAASLTCLFIFPQPFLRSMAMGGIAVALVAVVLALTLLPASIAILGRRTEALAVPWLRAEFGHREDTGFWHGVAMRVMRRPVIVAVALLAVLLAVASPFLRLRGSQPDARVLSPSVEARQVSDRISAGFQPHETTPHDVLIEARQPVLTPRSVGAIYDYAQQVAALPGVISVESMFSLSPGLSRDAYQRLFSLPAGQQDPALAAALSTFVRGNVARLEVISADETDGPLSLAQVQAIRRLPAPAGTTVLVGGASAQLTDLKSGLAGHVPTALALVALVTFVLLFLVFGSVTLPLKAMLMNLVSLSASYGAMVWIFQDGRLQGLLRFTSLGTVDATQPILMFAIVFGLSMDYEVLLLSRIREEYLRTGDNTLAVARGLEHTGRLITSAAALLAVVFGAFSTASLVFMKELGVGMTLAIVLDATLVRALLVPATMKLMGDWNWWAPAPLTRIWQRAGLGDLEGHAEAHPAPLPAAGD
ncbi:MAG: MMPL family transporter [Dehalococcoidia bacterium]